MSGRILIGEDAAAFVRAAAEEVTRLAARAARRRRFSIAISGGATPRPIHAALAEPPFADRFPWPAAAFYFADERCVPPDDPESNYGAARRDLFSRAPVDPALIHRIEGEREDIDAAAADYAALLPDALDILLLGMGEDGHTASLFPGSSALREEHRRALAVRDAPKPPASRITIAPPVIRAARAVVVLVAGANKAGMVARALSGPLRIDDIPVQLAREATWILDASAAMEL